MKKLTKIKLINWHLFSNQTIEINGNALISGENGSGKSTLLDALQYLLVGGRAYAKFNIAATDDAKRTLDGYIRGRIGAENKEFIRMGDVITHIALEFYDEQAKEYSLVGSILDLPRQGTLKERLYILENVSLSDDIFLDNKYPRDYKSMKAYLKTLGVELESFDSQKKYREALARFFGMDARKYAKILPKALAFRPIDLQNFVFEFLLDDEPIDIQSLKNNVEQLKKIEVEIKKDREKLEKLEVIEEKGDLILELTDQLAINEIIDQLNWIEKRETYIKKNQEDLAKIDQKIENLRHDKTLLDAQIEEKDTTILELERSKGNSDLSRTIESYKEALSKKSSELTAQKESIVVLKEMLFKEFNTIKQLNDLIQSKTLKEFVIYYQENSDNLEVLELSNLLQMVAKEIQNYLHAYHTEARKIEDERATTSTLMLQAQQRLNNLKKHVKTYPKYVETLISTLNDRLSEMYERKISVRPLCELLEVNDELWRNAIEGYLNTQRFDIIVDPTYFDDALEIYEAVKTDLKIYGVGLVNTQKLKAYDKIVENTLAEKVDTDDQYARYYVNMLLNTIYTVDNVHELKKFSRSITPTCMTYINHTARQINPRVYEVPFIGQRATDLQIQLETTEITNLDQNMEKLYDLSIKTNRIEKLLATSQAMQMVYQNQVRLFDDIKQTRRDYVLLEEQLEELMKNPSIANLESQIEREKNLRRQLRFEQETVISNIAIERDNKNRILEAIENAKEKIEQYQEKQKELNKKHPEKLVLANTQYHALKAKLKNDHDELDSYLVRSNASSNNQKLKLETEIIGLMRTYIIQFHFSAAPQLEYLIQFQQEANAIRNNNLIRYEQEAIELRRNSEISFKEEFVNKLRSSIESAQQQISELNVALKDKYFGTDTYQLIAKASENPEFKVYYDLIMSNDFVANQDLFTENLTKRHETILMELFEKIASSDPEYEKLSFQFLDYRNYMSYDIEVINQNGNKLFFSKVSREKSGGETQVPFYIVIAASFQQLLTRNKRVDSGCIVLFDEAFNNMDESRIDAMMDFYSSLSIQLLIAVPPQRVPNIINYVQTSLIVVKDDDYAIVESFKDQRTLV